MTPNTGEMGMDIGWEANFEIKSGYFLYNSHFKSYLTIYQMTRLLQTDQNRDQLQMVNDSVGVI